MKKVVVSVLVGALAVALLVVTAGAATGFHIPNGSIGLKQLTPQVRKLVQRAGRQGRVAPRPPGPAGPAGPAGPIGATGVAGRNGSSNVLTYSEVGGAGQPLVLTRADGGTQGSIGPLTFRASCSSEGEDTITGKFEVASNEDGVVLNGEALNQGGTKTLREMTVSGGGSKEDFTLIRATNADGSFAMQGVASYLVGLPGGCHFFGTLIEDS
jgi:hypothetical protein